MGRRDFTDILIKRGKLTPQKRDEAVAAAKTARKKLSEYLVEAGICEAKDVLSALATFMRLEFVELEEVEIAPDIIEKVPESVARENNIIPYLHDGGSLKILTADPEDLSVIDKLNFVLNQEVQLVVATKEQITEAINKYYGKGETSAVDSMLSQFGDTSLEFTDLEDTSAIEGAVDDPDAPIVKLVNLILTEAMSLRASDIHIEPFENRVRVRYRIDGALVERDSPPKRLLSAILTRVKIMSKIDITEKRRPQDGRMKTSLNGKDYDLRVSVLPTNHGQSVVMRLLDKDNIKISVKDLGFNEDDYRRFSRIIKRPNGIFLVTGPTGSGKTTTLYASMNELNRPDRKIITAEDPVEYYLSGINQCQVHADIGMTFQAIIKAMLRQAPNIILVGEIRDKETADIAIQASLTGHLVFSTLHTNDAPGSVTRLVDMGVQPFLVASSLMAVLAQRLVRKVCLKCKQPFSPTPDELRAVGINPERLTRHNFHKGTGCKNCNKTGYRGRIGVYELMTVTPAIRDLTFKRESHLVIRKQARADGMRTLFQDGLLKSIKGITTIDEVLNVTGMDE